MKLWFEWNDISSIDMKVVLSEVPDIIKPKKRYNSITVDGVDGSRIEELGYSSYVKQIEIGFAYTDVQKVEQWLNGSGKLVFCNEPDVYYEARILDEIKYTKDIIFCHAKVCFLVQPYKYALFEDKATGIANIAIYNDGNVNALPRVSISGTGNVNVLVNDTNVCTLVFGTTSRTLVLDSMTQDCTCDNALANRSMNGEFPVFVPGDNTISCSGTVTSLEVEVRTRWV